MKLDFTIYLEGTPQQTEELHTHNDSPLVLTFHNSVGSRYYDHKDPTLEEKFLSAEPDEILECEPHPDIQTALEFTPRCFLSYSNCLPTNPRAKALSETLDFIHRQGVAAYMTAINEVGFELLVRGANPSKGIEVYNMQIEDIQRTFPH